MSLSNSQTPLPLEELSWKITKYASIVSQYLAANNLPQPSLESDGPSTIVPSAAPQIIHQSLQELIGSALALFQLALSPSEFVPNMATGYQYTSCITWLLHYGIFNLVPLNGTISYVDLATTAGVPEQRLKGIMRMAMTNTLFREHPDGQNVKHSAASAFLARSDDVRAWAKHLCTMTAPTAMSLTASHQRWGPDTVRKNETAFNAAFDTDLPYFDHLSRDGTKLREFAALMRNVTSSKGMDLQYLVKGFSWDKVKEGSIVVDVGGSSGAAAIKLATTFSHLNFIVQDMQANTDRGREAVSSMPLEISSRLTFQAHDFTQPQPVPGAAVYLLRMILHDWTDAEAIIILQQLAAAMEPKSSRLLIMDTVLPIPGSVPVSVERIVRVRDMTMMEIFNSKERELESWISLLAAADKRFRLVNVVQPFGSDMSVLEVELDCC